MCRVHRSTGVVVGLVTGLVGAGGGFLVVPALALLGGLPMPVAVGTSLVVIAMKSFAGLAGYLSSVQHRLGPGRSAVTAAAVVGSPGRRPSRRDGSRPTTLRKAFGWFVLVMGVFVLVQQAPAAMVVPIVLTVALVAVAATACWRFVNACPLRRVVSA